MIGTINIQVGGDSNSLDVFDEEVADIVISTAGFAQIAAANGYVKLEPGQVVVQRELLVDAHTLLVFNNCDCNPCTRVKRDLLTALDAAEVPE